MAACTLALWFGLAAPATAQDAAALRAEHEQLGDQLAHNPFDRPLVLKSSGDTGDLRGDVYAVVDRPFDVVEGALKDPSHWCDLLILHLNVKYCGTSGGNENGTSGGTSGSRSGSGETHGQPPRESLRLVVGRKFDQPLTDGYRITFSYDATQVTRDYLRVQMRAKEGPMGSHDYKLVLESVPVDRGHSFLHLSYAYAYDMAARIALKAYLATLGEDKVGFSTIGKTADGKPEYVGGIRGLLERNTMRYYLAVEAYLDTLSAPEAERDEQRLERWFDATERFPRQLHEVERSDYLKMKRHELQRQRTTSLRPG